MAEGGSLEPLIITEERDTPEEVGGVAGGSVAGGSVAGGSVAAARRCGGESAPERAQTAAGKSDANAAGETGSDDQGRAKRPTDPEDNRTGPLAGEEKRKDGKPGGTEGKGDGWEGPTHGTARVHRKPAEPGDGGDERATQSDPEADAEELNSSERRKSAGSGSQEEDPIKASRLTPDFPEALYELLCTLQEGRRLNDQRCSFRLEKGMRRRRCHSEPNTSKPANRVTFSSMTSLQREEFFELVATAQGRRLDDQRAWLERSPPTKAKARGFRGSLRQLSFAKRPAAAAAVPAPVPKEDLYNMILTTQAQGRLEEQRSRAPGPVDDEDFFSLLLRVQGGRMDEQRTELPCLLQT